MRRVVGEPSPTDLSRSRWTWSKAKTLAASAWEAQIPGEGSYTGFYCGCSITRKGASGGVIDTASCGYRTRSNASRAKRLEWEHVLPASRIGRGRACWVQGARQCVRNGKAFKGRECCEMADATYNMAATDPVNLVPSVGEVNGDRSDMPYGELGTRPPSGTYTYGQCQALVSPSLDLAEPPDDRKGDVARVMAYMSQAYGLPFTPEEAQLYSSWMRMDPVSGEEIQINLAIEALGHRPNPLVLGR